MTRRGAAATALAVALAAGLALAGLAAVFADEALLQAAFAWRRDLPPVVQRLREFSALGSGYVLAAVTVAAVLHQGLFASKRAAAALAATVLGASALVSALKAAVQRARPDAAWADAVLPSPSFPSTHALMSTVVFVAVALVAARAAPTRARAAFWLALAAVAAAVVGGTRVALGVHHASDVVAGWTIGAVWAVGWAVAAGGASRR